MQVLSDPARAQEAAAVFRLLGDPTRIRILESLIDTPELCVHEIAAAIGSGETRVSQALRLLRTAGVVRNRRDGRHVYYRLDDDHVRVLLRAALDHIDHADHPDRGR